FGSIDRRDLWLPAWEQLRDDLGFDLLSLDTSRPTEWVPGAERIVRARERQMWAARQGEGKTQAALHLAVQVCEAGGRVMYIDVENDATEMAARIQAISASLAADEAVAERLSYLPDLSLKAMHEHAGLMSVWAQSLISSDLLIVDSITRVLSMCGYDENSNTDYAEWMRTYIDPIAKHGGGVAVLLLDNMGRSGDHARGAINKEALVEAVYHVSGGKKVSPTEHGLLSLRLDRSRSGRIAKYVTAESGGESFGPLVAQDGEAPKAGAMAEMQMRRSKISDHFASSDGEWMSLVDLKEHFEVSGNTLKNDLRSLVESGEVELWHERLGDRPAGRGDHWRSRR
ncbi:MAG TPA: AAA family ATPase, partial [Solirubrobacteraceae bacterium]|nr:AAA family ATPase [Solirubrobacteraceae bacterium]